MPTMSPGWMLSGTTCSRDSSTRMGSPAICGVAAANTNSHLGVMTAVPKELSLGFIRWTLNESNLSSYECGGFSECLYNGTNRRGVIRRSQVCPPGYVVYHT